MKESMPAPRYFTSCRRAHMPSGGVPFTGNASISCELKKRILAYDENLELHHIGPQVHMYRVKKYQGGGKGVYAAADIVVHQFILKWPPGEWLMDCLNSCDMWKKFRTPEIAAKQQIKLYKNPNDIAAALAEAKIKEIHEAVRPELKKYVDRQSSFSFARGSTPRIVR